jgi:hypothetical protein
MIRYISDVVRQWTGYAPAEFLVDPQLWYSCIHADDVARVRYAEQQFFDSREQLNLEYRIVGPQRRAALGLGAQHDRPRWARHADLHARHDPRPEPLRRPAARE